jgi:hypothetical protein
MPSVREKQLIAERIASKQQEIAELNARVREAEVYIQALRDVSSGMEDLRRREPGAPRTNGTESRVDKARRVLEESDQPLHISEIVELIGEEDTKASRASLAGQLAKYVRDGRVFARTGENVFWLLERGPYVPPAEAEDFPDLV